MNYAAMFYALQPGFFEKEYIRSLPPEHPAAWGRSWSTASRALA